MARLMPSPPMLSVAIMVCIMVRVHVNEEMLLLDALSVMTMLPIAVMTVALFAIVH